MSQNTLYIAELIFSEKLQQFDGDSSFPPVKKIGITTDHPERREKELLGTISPVKISIVKAWTQIDARKVESMLHTILDNTRLDGEYFWDGNETLIDAVTGFIDEYHKEAKEIGVTDDADVEAATLSIQKKNSHRIYSDVVPVLDELSIEHSVIKNGKGVTFKIGEYNLRLGSRTSGRYTLTIWSKNKTTEEALLDFENAQGLSAGGMENSDRRARIPMSKLDLIIDSISKYQKNITN